MQISIKEKPFLPCSIQIEQKIKIKQAKLFANARVTLLILFDDHIIPDAVELIKRMDAKEIKVYVFSMGSDPYTEDFAEVLESLAVAQKFT